MGAALNKRKLIEIILFFSLSEDYSYSHQFRNQTSTIILNKEGSWEWLLEAGFMMVMPKPPGYLVSFSGSWNKGGVTSMLPDLHIMFQDSATSPEILCSKTTSPCFLCVDESLGQAKCLHQDIRTNNNANFIFSLLCMEYNKLSAGDVCWVQLCGQWMQALLRSSQKEA